MPTYQYSCTECGEPLEVVQKFTDDALTECPACGGKLRKLYNAVGIVFKGSGFYRTDSRSGSSASDPAKSAASAGDGKSESAKSEPAKPASPKSDTAKPAAASTSSSSTSAA